MLVVVSVGPHHIHFLVLNCLALLLTIRICLLGGGLLYFVGGGRGVLEDLDVLAGGGEGASGVGAG